MKCLKLSRKHVFTQPQIGVKQKKPEQFSFATNIGFNIRNYMINK